jgi:hypothetical protein
LSLHAISVFDFWVVGAIADNYQIHAEQIYVCQKYISENGINL